MAFKGKAPKVPPMTSGHQQHAVLRKAHALTAGSNVAVRHPALPGPNMMAPRGDHMELPSGARDSSSPGGLTGGLAPFQTKEAAEHGEFLES